MVDEFHFFDEPQYDSRTGSEGTIDPVTGAEVNLPEMNMDFGGYRVKLKKGGSIGDFYGQVLKPMTKATFMSIRTRIR